MPPLTFARRPVLDSVEELLAGADRLGAFRPVDARSPAGFERVTVEGERCVVKYVHVDDDFALRAGGDIGCVPLRAWASGIMDAAPDHVDHATLGAARWGRNGWGAALLMRDVSDELVAPGDDPISEAAHHGFLTDLAAFSARTWEVTDAWGLLPPQSRWQFFGTWQLETEAALGEREPVPAIARDGWRRFSERAPAALVDVVHGLRRDVDPLVDALRATPWALLHGDWKLGNLGRTADGSRTVLIDWAYVGPGPVAHELCWYLALNRARLPLGHTKESTIADFERALTDRGVDLGGWWEQQLDLCLLGTVVQFGWEKALGPDDELRWWCERAAAGVHRL